MGYIILIPYVRALVVADGIFSFGPNDPTEATFTLNYLIDALASGTPRVEITKAHRRADSAADIPNFTFTGVDLVQNYDEIWMFGYEGSNDGGIAAGTTAISGDEVAAIAKFMNQGGGVFATGDHSGLGSFMCGAIPRVRSMRKWFDASSLPPGYPADAVGLGVGRLDTLRPDHSGQYWFDNQSDDIPQPLTVPNPHPVLQAANNSVVNQFPDHMHEGAVTTPWSTSDTLTYAGQSFIEYPSLAGHQELPQIIAWGTVLPGHTTPLEGSDSQQFSGDPAQTQYQQFGVVCAYDGSKVKVGRVVTDSSFHHFLDLNLTGDQLGVGDKRYGFKVSPAGQAVLDGMTRYYRNIAYWLAKQVHFFFDMVGFVLVQPWWWELVNPGGPVEENPEQILQYGALMRAALARYVSDTMTIDFVRGELEDAGLRGLLPAEPWKPGARTSAASPFVGDIVDAALGGAAMAMMAARFKAPDGKLSSEQLRQAGRQGLLVGTRAIGRHLQSIATRIAQVGAQLSKASIR
jgi:hypothetical protein